MATCKLQEKHLIDQRAAVNRLATMSEINSIESLRSVPFSRRTFEEKNKIISSGRPTPAVVIIKTRKHFARHFQASTYEKNKWLTGCPQVSKLFCWPCLLFSTDRTVWTATGYDDLNNLHISMSKHERGPSHIRCVVKLKTFENTLIEYRLNEGLRLDAEQHNARVKKNREVLKRLVDIVVYLGAQRQPFRGHAEEDRGNYNELVHLLRKYDERLDHHLESSTTFSGPSSRIQNDLIEAVASVVLNEITSEIKDASFVSILLDETTDASNLAQLSTVWRYVTKEGEVEERFVGFSDVRADRTAAVVAEHVFAAVDEMQCGDKLVGQTYDGAAVTSGHLNDLQAKVRERHPSCGFVHCIAHILNLNLALSQACSTIKDCKVFFSTLNGLASFFASSTKRAKALDDIVKRRLPRAAPTRWNTTSVLVNTAKDNHRSLIELFNDIRNNPLDWDERSILSAGGFLQYLEDPQDPKVLFLLHLFSDVFSLTDVLSNILQTKCFDVGYCVSQMKRITEQLQRQRGEFERVFALVPQPENPAKRCRGPSDMKTEYEALYFKALDVIDSQMQQCLSSLEKMAFVSLLDFNRFHQYEQAFPDAAIDSLKYTYGHFFDDGLLRSELKVLYESTDLNQENVPELTHFMRSNGLCDAMPQLYKLCELFLTLPSAAAWGEKTFSGLKRIKSYQRNATGQHRSSGLAVMSIERRMLQKIKSDESFYDKVSVEFTKKARRMEFVYK
ncbi:zinc finger MYM-type protein 1 [Vanacampus margaritifer]